MKFRRLDKKNLRFLVTFVIPLLIILTLLFPFFADTFQIALKQPFNIFSFLRREVGAVISFQSNYLRSEELQQENDLLKSRINSLRDVAFENSRLHGLLSLKQNSTLSFIASKVIARSSDSWSSMLVIDKGRRLGIRRGMAVMNYFGVVGRVIDTQEFSAKVLLITDPNLGVSAIVQRSRQEGLVCGTLGPRLTMRYLPEGADIKVDDVIVTSGLNSAYPKGLLIGKVTGMGKEFSGLSTYAVIDPAVNFSNIEEVLVVVP